MSRLETVHKEVCITCRVTRGIALLAITVVFLAGCGGSNSDNNMTLTDTKTETIAFGGLSGNGSQFIEYNESGFSVASGLGSWEVMESYGNPAPAIIFMREADEPEFQGEVEITSNGSLFSFNSVDLYSSITPIPYTIKGFRDSELVFTLSDTVPNTFGKFKRVENPESTDAIDTLTIRLSNPATPCCSNPMGLDNIVVSH